MSYSVRNIVIALVLALVAAGLVVMYTSNVKSQADKSIKTTTVVVSKGDIVAGTPVNTLVTGNAFATRQVATKDVVPGAFTSVELAQHVARDRHATSPPARRSRRRCSRTRSRHGDREPDPRHRCAPCSSRSTPTASWAARSRPATTSTSTVRGTIQASSNNSKFSQQTVAARIITNVEVLSTYDTGVATAPLTAASGANSASGTADGTGGDAVILAIPQNLSPDVMLVRATGGFWMALRPSHGAQDTGSLGCDSVQRRSVRASPSSR